MEVILKFIGIILLVANPETNPTKYEVYIQDARTSKHVCGKDRMPHYPAIRVRVPGVTSSWWNKPKPCTDGKPCQLFELKHGRIEIDGITDGQGRLKPGSFTNIPRFRGDMHVNALIPPADRENISAGWLTLTNGVLTDGVYPRSHMPYAMLTATLPNLPAPNGVVTIKAGNDWIKIPAQTATLEIDFVDLPESLAKGDFDGPPSNERGHFEWHYRYADANNQTCETPLHASAARKQGSTSHARATTPSTKTKKTNGTTEMDLLSANADCSATTWP